MKKPEIKNPMTVPLTTWPGTVQYGNCSTDCSLSPQHTDTVYTVHIIHTAAPSPPHRLATKTSTAKNCHDNWSIY
jgi:hypothetical protein